MVNKFKNDALFRSAHGSDLIRQVIAQQCKLAEILPKLGIENGQRKQVERFIKHVKDHGWQVS